MARKPKPLTEQLREVIDSSGMSRYRLCKEIDLAPPAMSRFMNGKGGFSLEVLDRIGQVFELELVARRKDGPPTKEER